MTKKNLKGYNPHVDLRTTAIEVGSSRSRSTHTIELLDSLGVDTLSKESGLSVEKVREALNIIRNLYAPRSLQTPQYMDTGEAVFLEDIIEDKTEDTAQFAETGVLKREVEDLLKLLPPRLELIMRLRFGLDGQGTRTLEEVGRLVGVTRERVRQLEIICLRKLRPLAESRNLQDYIDIN